MIALLKTMLASFWVRLAATLGGAFLLAVLIIDQVEQMPTETERCAKRMVDLYLMDRAAQKKPPAMSLAETELRALRMCSGIPPL